MAQGTEPAPGEIPSAESTWATDPLSGPLPAEPDPAGTRRSGTWPTSAGDLLDGPPEGNGTGPDEFAYLPDEGADDVGGQDPTSPSSDSDITDNRVGPPASGPASAFTVTLSIDPVNGEGPRFDLTVIGSPADLYALVESVASRFVEQVTPL